MFFVFSLVLAILMGKRNSDGLGKRADADGASTTSAAVADPVAPDAPVLTDAEEMRKQLESLGVNPDALPPVEGGDTPGTAPAELPAPTETPEAPPTEAPELTEEAPAPEATAPTEEPAPAGVTSEELPPAEEAPAPAGE